MLDPALLLDAHRQRRDAHRLADQRGQRIGMNILGVIVGDEAHLLQLIPFEDVGRVGSTCGARLAIMSTILEIESASSLMVAPNAVTIDPDYARPAMRCLNPLWVKAMQACQTGSRLG